MASCEESDEVTEMALISESLKKSSDQVIIPATSTATASSQPSEGFDSSEATSQDVTLSEVRERTLDEKSSRGKVQEVQKNQDGTAAWSPDEGGFLQEERLNKGLHFWTCGPTAQPADGLVSHLQTKFLHRDKGHNGNIETPSSICETPAARSALEE